MAALYYCRGDQSGEMLHVMREAMPDLEIRPWPDTLDKQDIDRAIVWMPPENFFDGLSYNNKRVGSPVPFYGSSL